MTQVDFFLLNLRMGIESGKQKQNKERNSTFTVLTSPKPTSFLMSLSKIEDIMDY